MSGDISNRKITPRDIKEIQAMFGKPHHVELHKSTFMDESPRNHLRLSKNGRYHAFVPTDYVRSLNNACRMSGTLFILNHPDLYNDGKSMAALFEWFVGLDKSHGEAARGMKTLDNIGQDILYFYGRKAING